jgi:uncharacterized damage-inducible protein DinB
VNTLPDAKAMLLHYLQGARTALLWKCEGLSERELRMPRTGTGTNLIGLVKHALSNEIGYFGETFGREWPDPDEIPWMQDFDEDPNADFYLTAYETSAGLLDLYRRVAVWADATITELPLEAPGKVPWWGDRGDVTLHRVLVHVISDLERHAGHADILREQIDGAIGLVPKATNIPDIDQHAYLAKVRALAESFPDES